MWSSIVRKTQFTLVTLGLVCGATSCHRSSAEKKAAHESPANRPATPLFTTAQIPEGTFQMGDDNGHADQRPAHQVALQSFVMDTTEVTVAAFEAFVARTHYKTDAERLGTGAVFHPETDNGVWRLIQHADWRHPEGASSRAAQNEPVVQVSWNDARAFCEDRHARLPTEAEWEYAARGGGNGPFPWGSDDTRAFEHANYWQGHFPDENTLLDHFARRAPVKTFPPNAYGLYDMAGNVWEWTADYYSASYYAESPEAAPKGPTSGLERVMRGGSFLCAPSYCAGYRVAARNHATADSSFHHVGFRCVTDPE